jgi:hypothetical protein
VKKVGMFWSWLFLVEVKIRGRIVVFVIKHTQYVELYSSLFQLCLNREYCSTISGSAGYYEWDRFIFCGWKCHGLSSFITFRCLWVFISLTGSAYRNELGFWIQPFPRNVLQCFDKGYVLMLLARGLLGKISEISILCSSQSTFH